MFRRFSSLVGLAALAATTLLPRNLEAHGGGHGGGGHGGHAGAYHGGAYHGGFHHGYYGGFHPYYGRGFSPFFGGGFYRPYYGFGLGGLGGLGGFGFGGGGLGLGGFGLGGYGLGGYGPYLPYYGGYGMNTPVIMANPPNVPLDPYAPPPAQTPPPPDNAAHLQLVVPENAEVLFGGETTKQTGSIREFVSPPIASGKVFTYTIAVRYMNAAGKPIDDRRLIYVRANDWFRIDFTRPAPPERSPAPLPRPE